MSKTKSNRLIHVGDTVNLTVGHLRRARRALDATTPAEEG